MIRTAACSSYLDVTLCSSCATLPTLQMNLVGQNGLADSRLLETGPVRLLETGPVSVRSGLRSKIGPVQKSLEHS